MDPRLFVDKKSARIIATSIIIIIIGIVIVVIIISTTNNSINSPSSSTTSQLSRGNVLSSSSIMIGQSNAQKEEEQKRIVPLDQIVSGGPPPDGIPSIDNPKFVTVQEASNFLSDSDLILGLNINGDIRAYPLQILVWHEIVNDKVGVPVAVTYCPLCFTNQVFNSTTGSNQIVLQFGTSGKLYTG